MRPRTRLEKRATRLDSRHFATESDKALSRIARMRSAQCARHAVRARDQPAHVENALDAALFSKRPMTRRRKRATFRASCQRTTDRRLRDKLSAADFAAQKDDHSARAHARAAHVRNAVAAARNMKVRTARRKRRASANASRQRTRTRRASPRRNVRSRAAQSARHLSRDVRNDAHAENATAAQRMRIMASARLSRRRLRFKSRMLSSQCRVTWRKRRRCMRASAVYPRSCHVRRAARKRPHAAKVRADTLRS